MDSRPNNNSMLRLFSRGSTPPNQPPQTQSYGPMQPSNAPNPIESLFQRISPGSDHLNQLQSQPMVQTSDNYSPTTTTTNMSLLDEPNTGSSPNQNATNADRQSALLSLLGASTGNNRQAQPSNQTQTQTQQVPTPPGSASQRTGGPSPNHNETQGKILLEQLMSGNPPRSTYTDSQLSSLSGSVPSPPYGPTPREGEYNHYSQADPVDVVDESVTLIQPYPPIAPQKVTQQEPPSPRKSMFDFVSPFDALSSSGSIRKKPVPQPPSLSSGNDDSSSWTAISDPKRQSVDNLLENLTKQTSPLSQPPPVPYESYIGGSNEYAPVSEPQRMPAQTLPLPPKPTTVPVRTASPRDSPPKVQAGRAPAGGRFADSPASQSGGSPASTSRRDKESSPGPRGYRNKGGPVGQSKMNIKSANQQPQTIIFDVSQPHEEIQAPLESVKSTAIALVRQDPIFIPGTTIGATHWVAYAMSKGRVRVISRSSGDRTLLQLPPLFPGSMICDMAVFGNRLAGVTNDGGFVVWELPPVITDDVPGQILMCLPPSHDSDALRAVKWHPRDANLLAIMSEDRIYLIDLNTIPIRPSMSQVELENYADIFATSSVIAAFDFDVLHYTLATITVDSILTIWNIQGKVPYSTHKIRGDDIPSSLTFVDGGIVIGRKNGTILQLLSNTNKNVLSTVKFVNGTEEDPYHFGHVSYDSRIETLWVANYRRDSMIALKINLESSVIAGEEAIRGSFEQIIEFIGPKPAIHFVILTGDADPSGEEAYAACVAAKVNPGELALVAFSVHSTGVDQILIRKEWYESAMATTSSKLPQYSPAVPAPLPPLPPPQVTEPKRQLQSQIPAPARARTPPSEDVDADVSRDEPRAPEPKGKGQKGKNVNFKEEKEKSVKVSDDAIGQIISKEVRRSEDNLHSRISRMLNKEMEKQHQRLEESRAADQQDEFARQEKMLKLISNELTRNTTRVVEQAVKTVIQSQVIPSLEEITRTEVKLALDDQVGRGFVELIGQTLPVEIEKLLLRPDISRHFSHLLMSNLSPVIERQIKDSFSKTLVQQSSEMHQELIHDLRNEIHKMKNEMLNWQNETIRNQESSIRDLDRLVRSLSEQMKFMTTNPAATVPSMQQPPPRHSSPVIGAGPSSNNMSSSHMRQNMPQTMPHHAAHTGPAPSTYMPYSYPQQPPPLPQTWQAPLAAPQASHPATIPQPPQHSDTPPVLTAEQWDETYLQTLHLQDLSKLRDLLSKTNPDVVLPLNGPPLVSQAVILTLVHRLSAIIGDANVVPPNDDVFKTSLWWLQRSVSVLRPDDKLISDFISRVVPNVIAFLSDANRRLAILPVGPQTKETAKTLNETVDVLRRKCM